MATSDNIRINAVSGFEADAEAFEVEPEPEFEPETPTNPRVACELPSQILISEEVTPRLRTTWIDSPARMRSILIFNRVDQAFEHLARGLWRLFFLGVLLHVAAHFAPELREQLPVVYSVTDGAMELINFLWIWALKLLRAILPGGETPIEAINLMREAVDELLREFGNWLTTI